MPWYTHSGVPHVECAESRRFLADRGPGLGRGRRPAAAGRKCQRVPRQVGLHRGDFAEKFQLALEALNWSRTQCARELGVDKSVVSRWASGGARPTEHNLTRFTAMIQRAFPRFQAGDWRVDAALFAALFRAETHGRPPYRCRAGARRSPILAFDNMSGDPERRLFRRQYRGGHQQPHCPASRSFQVDFPGLQLCLSRSRHGREANQGSELGVRAT